VREQLIGRLRAAAHDDEVTVDALAIDLDLAHVAPAALRDDGLLVACHWLPSFQRRASRTDVVHRCLGQGLHEAFHYRDADFVLQGWTRSSLSLARNEGLR